MASALSCTTATGACLPQWSDWGVVWLCESGVPVCVQALLVGWRMGIQRSVAPELVQHARLPAAAACSPSNRPKRSPTH